MSFMICSLLFVVFGLLFAVRGSRFAVCGLWFAVCGVHCVQFILARPLFTHRCPSVHVGPLSFSAIQSHHIIRNSPPPHIHPPPPPTSITAICLFNAPFFVITAYVLSHPSPLRSPFSRANFARCLDWRAAGTKFAQRLQLT